MHHIKRDEQGVKCKTKIGELYGAVLVTIWRCARCGLHTKSDTCGEAPQRLQVTSLRRALRKLRQSEIRTQNLLAAKEFGRGFTIPCTVSTSTVLYCTVIVLSPLNSALCGGSTGVLGYPQDMVGSPGSDVKCQISPKNGNPPPRPAHALAAQKAELGGPPGRVPRVSTWPNTWMPSYPL